jgi:hypothetical protein
VVVEEKKEASAGLVKIDTKKVPPRKPMMSEPSIQKDLHQGVGKSAAGESNAKK